MRSVLILLFLVLTLLSTASCYPVRCKPVGDSPVGVISDCDVQHDPLPFHWTTTIKLKKNIKWAGMDDVRVIYSNPNETLTVNCTMTVPTPGTYSHGDLLTVEHQCTKFTPALMQGASLAVMFFLTHSFDQVLMFSFPIPGYDNRVVSSKDKPWQGETARKVVDEKQLSQQ